jgi:hypothetical protein
VTRHNCTVIPGGCNGGSARHCHAEPMPTDAQAMGRADRIARRFGLTGEPVRHDDGWSNDVWLYEDVVIRIAAGPGPGTLSTEAELAPRLPAAVGYPRLLGSGVLDGYEWMAEDRVPGDNLAGAWDSLTSDQRAYAVADLWGRLEAVTSADLTGLIVPSSPLYAFAPEPYGRQLETARSIVGGTVAERADALVRTGLDAISLIPAALVHTDAVLSNVIWTGSAAIPVDFEFASVGPVDLDLDCVGREVLNRQDRAAIQALRNTIAPTLDRPRAIDRLRAYAVLRDLWAVSLWAERDPGLTDASTWEPVRDLVADTNRSGWIDRLLEAAQ